MVPNRLRFLTDVLRHVDVVAENNWDDWCHFSKEPAFWAERGAKFLEAYSQFWHELEEPLGKLGDAKSRQLLYAILVYRVLGYRHVKLPINTPDYWQKRALAEAAVVRESAAKSWIFDLPLLRWGEIEYVGHPAGTMTLFALKQYQFERDGIVIKPKPGDVVLDLGGCWGDSGLAFADAVGDDGKVYVFEFVEGNLAIAQDNFASNDRLKPRIELVRHPVSDRTGDVLYYVDQGPATEVRPSPEGATGSAKTVTVDDFVALREIDRIDFIKMDIEGAEEKALQGAAETIRRFKPKLAISAYHMPFDPVVLFRRILEIRPDYQLYLDHYTLFDQETVLYAI